VPPTGRETIMKDKDKEFDQELADEARELAGEESVEEESPAAPSSVAGELEQVKNRLAYLAAEFDNYRKRSSREKDALISFANERLLRAILPFLDNLERAISLGGSSASSEGLLEGVQLTYEQFLAEMRKFGLEQISAEGKPFDPNLHEAIAQVPWEGTPEGMVLSEARKGYLLNGRLLRPAQVTVAARPAGSADRENGPDPEREGREN
jgi:molecular chaperone GrpE